MGGWEGDLLLGDVRSLKQKRSVVRPIIAEVRRTFQVAIAEVGHLDLHRRTMIGVAVVAADSSHAGSVLDAVERFIAERPDVELLSTHRELRTLEDMS